MILQYLQSGRTITAMEALDKFSCFRLASRISDLKKTHSNIERTMVNENGKSWASYKMVAKRDLFE